MPRINTEFVNRTNAPGEYRDDELKGFTLRIRETTSGGQVKPVKTYVVLRRIKGGGLVRYTIGRHGDCTVKQARDIAERVLLEMKQGIDPRVTEEKKRIEDATFRSQQKAVEKERGLTLRVVFEDWCKDHHKTRDSTKQLYRDCIFKHLAEWLDKPMNDISEQMVKERYRVVSLQTVASANNSFRPLRMLFNWAKVEYKDAAGKSLIPTNPVTVLSERGSWEKVKPRTEDYIHDDDLPAWFDAVSHLKNKHIAAYFKLMLATGMRRDEAKSLRWEDVNWKRRHFTARNTKNGRDLVLPITPYVEELLRECEAMRCNEFVFPGEHGKGHLKDPRFQYQFVAMKAGIRFTPHFARRTFAYAAARARLGESERKRLLNHLDSGDVTEFSYTPWQIDQLREPSEIVQNSLLQKSRLRNPSSENILLENLTNNRKK